MVTTTGSLTITALGKTEMETGFISGDINLDVRTSFDLVFITSSSILGKEKSFAATSLTFVYSPELLVS